MASGKGGHRPGAGAKPKNYWQHKLSGAIDAIERGFAYAGQAKGIEDPEEAKKEAIARIVSDAILAGQGLVPLKLYSDLIAKTSGNADEGESGKGKSALIEAMERCPGLLPGSSQAQTDEPENQTPATARPVAHGTVDLKSSAPDFQPFFDPQTPLFSPQELAGRSPAGGPPHPPAAPSRTPLIPRAENFENFEAAEAAKA
jgi:hypothetical protein